MDIFENFPQISGIHPIANFVRTVERTPNIWRTPLIEKSCMHYWKISIQ